MKLRYKIPLLITTLVFLAAASIFLFLSLKYNNQLKKEFTYRMKLMALNLKVNGEKLLTTSSDTLAYQKMNLTLEKSLLDLSQYPGVIYIVLRDRNKKIVKLKFFENKNLLNKKTKASFNINKIKKQLIKRNFWFSSIYKFFLYKEELVTIKKKPSYFQNLALLIKYWKHKSPKMILPVLQYSEPIQFSYSVSKGKNLKKTLGYIDIGVSKKYINSLIRNVFQKLIIPDLIIFLIVVTLAILLTLDIILPIGTLEKGARLLANGKLKHRIKLKRKDEFGKFAETFNLMAQKLSKTLQELKDKYEEVQKLFKLATEDGLTKAFVHRFLMELLDKEIERSKRNNSYLSFIMTDIDHFKKFNDTYGHQTGDYVLEQVSKTFLKNVRKNIDIVGRYGGEEFGIILPDTDKNGALQTAEKLRKLVAAQKHKFKGNEFQVQISLGVSTIKSGSTTKETLVKWADKALYNSKETGRNKTSFTTGDKNV